MSDPRLADDDNERRLGQLMHALRSLLLDVQRCQRRKVVVLTVVVESGRISDDSTVAPAPHYPLRGLTGGRR